MTMASGTSSFDRISRHASRVAAFCFTGVDSRLVSGPIARDMNVTICFKLLQQHELSARGVGGHDLRVDRILCQPVGFQLLVATRPTSKCVKSPGT